MTGSMRCGTRGGAVCRPRFGKGRYFGVLAGAIAALLVLAGCAAQPDQPLRFVAGADAEYPTAARADGVEGYVVVEYNVDEGGRVRSARVVESEPEGVFDQAALDAVTEWRFEAPVVDGQRQTVTGLRSRVAFQLGEPEEYVAP